MASTFLDVNFRIKDDAAPSRQIAFYAGNISLNNTRTIFMPDRDVYLDGFYLDCWKTDCLRERTNGAGVTVENVLIRDDLVDGRDVAADGAKLDGIAPGADMTNTANVDAAGAVMDSDFGTNGIMTHIGPGAYVSRNILGTTNQITVVNGDGVAGDITLSLPQSIDIAATVCFAQILTDIINEKTLNAGVTVDGVLIKDGLVDGRDIAADGATLDSLAAMSVTPATVAAAGAVMDTDFTSNGLMIRLSPSGTYTSRIITGTTNQVTVTNGDGVLGNPTLSLPQDIHTLATPSFSALFTDTIDEQTPTVGVTIDGVLLKDNDVTAAIVCATSQVQTNIINEKTRNAGVTIDGVLIKDGLIDGRDISADGATLDSLIVASVTPGTVAAAGAIMDGDFVSDGIMVRLSPSGSYASRQVLGTTNQVIVGNGTGVAGDITLALPQDIHTNATPTFSGVLADSVNEKTTNAGVTIDGVLAKDGDLTVSTLNYTTLNPPIASGGGPSGAFVDNVFTIEDDLDGTKKVAFQVANVSTGTTRTMTIPDCDINLGGGAGILHVATSGSCYTTIAAALAAATAGQVVLVNPGTYPESVTIPANIALVGHGSTGAVVITGSNTSSARVTMDNTSTLRNITVVAPSTGTNPAIDCSGLSIGLHAVIFNIVIIGAGGTGPGILGAGSGIVAIIQGCYHNGGVFGDAVVKITSGTCIASEIAGNVGQSTDLVKVTGGTIHCSTLQTAKNALYTCDDVIEVNGGTFEANNLIIPEDTPAQNALHISGDGIRAILSGSHLNGQVYDVLVDPGLTGTGSTLTLQGTLRDERFSFPDGYRTVASANALYIDLGSEENTGTKILGELSVGKPDWPTKSSFGEGQSSTIDMFIFNHNVSFIDLTGDAKSRSGSTFNLLQGTSTSDIAYFGHPSRKFFGLYIKVVTALTGGNTAWQYWNGSSWDDVSVMDTNDEFPHEQYASSSFQRIGCENIRFNYNKMDTDWTLTTVNSQSAYWIRFYPTSTITTIPVLEHVKLHTNHREIGECGNPMMYGKGERLRPLHITAQYPWNINNYGMDDSSSSGHLSDILDNKRINFIQRLFKDERENGFTSITYIPHGMDTSRKAKVIVKWCPKTNNSGNVELQLRVSKNIEEGDIVFGSAAPPTDIYNIVESVPHNSYDKMFITTFEIDVSAGIADTEMLVTLSRDATGSNNPPDTLSGDILVYSFLIQAYYWLLE